MIRPPDLQELVARHGACDRITPKAWADYDAAVVTWRAAYFTELEQGLMWRSKCSNISRQRKEIDMPKVSEVYRGRFLKAEDLPEKGETKVKIERVETELIEDFKTKEPVDKIILYFVRRNACLPLNPSNARLLAEDYGDEASSWVGQEIFLFRKTYPIGGRMQLGVGVRGNKQLPPISEDMGGDEVPW